MKSELAGWLWQRSAQRMPEAVPATGTLGPPRHRRPAPRGPRRARITLILQRYLDSQRKTVPQIAPSTLRAFSRLCERWRSSRGGIGGVGARRDDKQPRRDDVSEASLLLQD